MLSSYTKRPQKIENIIYCEESNTKLYRSYMNEYKTDQLIVNRDLSYSVMGCQLLSIKAGLINVRDGNSMIKSLALEINTCPVSTGKSCYVCTLHTQSNICLQ